MFLLGHIPPIRRTRAVDRALFFVRYGAGIGYGAQTVGDNPEPGDVLLPVKLGLEGLYIVSGLHVNISADSLPIVGTSW